MKSNQYVNIMQDLIPINRLIPVFGRFSGQSYSGKDYLDSRIAHKVKDNPSRKLLTDILASILDEEPEAYGLRKERVERIVFLSEHPLAEKIKSDLIEHYGVNPSVLTGKDKPKEARILYVVSPEIFARDEERKALDPNVSGIRGLGSFPKTKANIEGSLSALSSTNTSILVLIDEPEPLRMGQYSTLEAITEREKLFPETLSGAITKALLGRATCFLRLCLPRKGASGLWLAGQPQRDIEYLNDDESGTIKFRLNYKTLNTTGVEFTRLDLEAEKVKREEQKMSNDKKARLNKIISAVQDAPDKWSEKAWLESAWKIYRERGNGKDTDNVKKRFKTAAREFMSSHGVSVPKSNIIPFVITNNVFSIN